MAEQTVKPGDVTQRVGVEVIRARGVDVEKLIKMLVANAAAEFASTYYYYTILRMHLAGHEDYKEICEDARIRQAVLRPRFPIRPRRSTSLLSCWSRNAARFEAGSPSAT